MIKLSVITNTAEHTFAEAFAPAEPMRAFSEGWDE